MFIYLKFPVADINVIISPLKRLVYIKFRGSEDEAAASVLYNQTENLGQIKPFYMDHQKQIKLYSLNQEWTFS